MGFFLIKTMVSALIIAVASEIAKRSTPTAALIASLPLVTILTYLWIYNATNDPKIIVGMAHSMLWMIIPSAAFFVILPWLLHLQWSFYLSLALATIVTAVLTGLVAFLLASRAVVPAG